VFILIAVIGEKDFWFSGFANEAECEAQALLIEFDWWACVPVFGF
jgi:hypothetical protein